jgi:cell division protein ZapB
MPIVMRLVPNIVTTASSVPMTDSDKFEEKLDRLIELCQQLKRENQSLREREAGLVGERSQLIEKNEMARQKIETMINRLRNLSAEQ